MFKNQSNIFDWVEVCDVSCEAFFFLSYDLQNKKICIIVIFDKNNIFNSRKKFLSMSKTNYLWTNTLNYLAN